jgi:hypothetical protein
VRHKSNLPLVVAGFALAVVFAIGGIALALTYSPTNAHDIAAIRPGTSKSDVFWRLGPPDSTGPPASTTATCSEEIVYRVKHKSAVMRWIENRVGSCETRVHICVDKAGLVTDTSGFSLTCF